MPEGLEFILVGLITGALAGAIGAGGGFATVVLLVAFGVDPHASVGTSLVYVMVVATWGTVVHLRQRTANPYLGLLLGLPAIATAVVGAQVGSRLSDRTLTLAFGALTAAVAAFLLRPSRKPASEAAGDQPPLPVSGAQIAPPSRTGLGPRRKVAAVGGGAAVGFVQGIFGVGGGFLFLPLLVLVLRAPEAVAAGTSLFAVLLGSVAAGARHASLGNVDGHVLAYMVPAGIVSISLGAKASKRLPPRVLRGTFVVVMLSSAAYLLVKGA